jgi:FdhD protein
LSEGIIHQPGDWISAKHYPRNEFGNVIDVFLNPDLDIDFKKLTRHVFGSSSCGLCGKATLDSILTLAPELACEGTGDPLKKESESASKPKSESAWVSPEVLWKVADSVKIEQITFHRTGGLHASAVIDSSGEIIILREDVGRHNALDKALGFGLINQLLPYKKKILWVSGRTSFEIMQKAWAGGVEVVAGVSAPSSLAVALAKKTGQTLIGFLRPGRFNIYSGSWRIQKN